MSNILVIKSDNSLSLNQWSLQVTICIGCQTIKCHYFTTILHFHQQILQISEIIIQIHFMKTE